MSLHLSIKCATCRRQWAEDIEHSSANVLSQHIKSLVCDCGANATSMVPHQSRSAGLHT